MDLISLVVVLVIVGVILYVVNTLIPMDGNIKKIINIVVILFVCLWLLSALLGWGGLGSVRIGR